MPKGLEDAQNEAIRDFVRHRVMPLYNGNQGDVAKRLGQSPASFSEFMRGKRGGSMSLATLLGALMGVDAFEVLGAVPSITHHFTLSHTTGFEGTMRLAQVQFKCVTPAVWELLRGITFPDGEIDKQIDPIRLGLFAMGLQHIVVKSKD